MRHLNLVWKLVLVLNLVSVVQLTVMHWHWSLIRIHNNLPRLVSHDPVPILNLLRWQKLMYTHSPVRKRRKLYWVHRDWIDVTSLKYSPVYVTRTNKYLLNEVFEIFWEIKVKILIIQILIMQHTEQKSINYSNDLDLKILEQQWQWKHCLKSEFSFFQFS